MCVSALNYSYQMDRKMLLVRSRPLTRWPLTFRKVKATLVWSIVAMFSLVSGQTEGDTGYDYHSVYENEYDSNLSELGKEPSFDAPLANVTFRLGETALLPCTIEHLGKYKVAWLEHNSIPLTFEDRRVIDDSRFSIVRPAVKDWNLQIQDVRLEDDGPYRCTVNIKPVISKTVWLIVTVPAAILDEWSSRDKTIPEGHDVTFTCNVTGVPRPEVTWFRWASAGRASETDAGACRYGNISTGRQEREETAGGVWMLTRGRNSLTIVNVSRHCDDVYECQASNGKSPTVTRKMRLIVEFRPEISLPNRRIGQSRGRQTILECIVSAYPQAVNYWEKEGRIVTSSTKHKIEAYDESQHTFTLSLRIIDLESSDYGFYNCVAANRLGKDEQTMQLYETLDVDPMKQTMMHRSPRTTPPTEGNGRGGGGDALDGVRSSWEEQGGRIGFSLAPQPVLDATPDRDPGREGVYKVVGSSLASRSRALSKAPSSHNRPSSVAAIFLAIVVVMATTSGTFGGDLANHEHR